MALGYIHGVQKFFMINFGTVLKTISQWNFTLINIPLLNFQIFLTELINQIVEIRN